MRWTRLTLALFAAGLGGCASNAPSSVLAEGPRMIDLYRGTAAPERESAPEETGAPGTGARCRWWLFSWPCEAPAAETGESDGDAGAESAAYARSAANELELLFPRLPNPDIYIHVLPHLATDDRVPVPGYTTAVPLYERVEYALPGELERATRLLEPGSGGEPAAADGSATGRTPEDGTPAPEDGEAP